MMQWGFPEIVQTKPHLIGSEKPQDIAQCILSHGEHRSLGRFLIFARSALHFGLRYYFGDDLLVIRLRGSLAAAEQNLVKSLRAENGRDLLKQVRSRLIETTRPVMEAMVEKVTGVKILTMHHDICITTGEEVILFTLASVVLFA